MVKKDGKKGQEILSNMKKEFENSESSDTESSDTESSDIKQFSNETSDSEDSFIKSEKRIFNPIPKDQSQSFSNPFYSSFEDSFTKSSNTKAAPSTERIGSVEWNELSSLDPDTMKLVLQIIPEETIKYESGSSSYPMISFCISMGKDRIKQKKLEKEKETIKNESNNDITTNRNYTEEPETETPEERQTRLDKNRRAWLERTVGTGIRPQGK